MSTYRELFQAARFRPATDEDPLAVDEARHEVERLRRELERTTSDAERLQRELSDLKAELARAYDESLRLRAELPEGGPTQAAPANPPRMWPGPARVARSADQLARRAWHHYRLHGGRSLMRRVRLVDRYGTWGLEPVPETLPEGVVPNDPRLIFSCLDAPSLQSTSVGAGHLSVEGWAWSPAGVLSIDLYVDGEPVGSVLPNLQRRDVAYALRQRPGSLVSGFKTELPVETLSPGSHQLIVAVLDADGRCRVFARTFRILGRDDAYDVYYHASLAQRRNYALPTVDRDVNVHVWVAVKSDVDLDATLESIRAQRGVRWRCTVFDPHPGDDWTRTRLADAVRRLGDRRIKYSAQPNPLSAGKATFHVFLSAGELLGPDALTTLAAAGSGGAGIVYSDHDTVDQDGVHCDPVFAPDWSPDHILARNYVGGVFLARSGEWLSRADWKMEFGSYEWRYELLLALGATGQQVVHVPRVTWSSSSRVLTGSAEIARAELSAVEDFLRRGQLSARVSDTSAGSSEATAARAVRRIEWAPSVRKVSIVIPTTGRLDFVRTCVTSILERTDYPNFELLFLDNGRGRNRDGITFIESHGIRVVRRDEPFNWARLSNAGARETNGDLLLFLNDDIEIVERDWLGELVRQGMRPGIGTVGAMLLYPDGRIQHAGVFLVDHGGGARHLFQWQDPDAPLYGELHRVSREVAANTGACMLVRRELFESLGGFDESFEIALNDVDFCLRLMERGYRNVWTPHSRLIHHEKASRQQTNVVDDERLMWRRWEAVLRRGDPYYNPNLTRTHTDCRVDLSRLRLN
jgi:GT2 family glycosyltransferase